MRQIRRKAKAAETAAPASLDAIDRKILNALQDDNQLTNLKLADRVGLSAPACLRRVRRLRTAGVIIKDVALVDPAKVGQTVIAFVGVELDRQREDVLASFEAKIAKEPQVQQCYFVSGEIDYLLVVACKDIDSYNAFARRVLANEHNIKCFRTSFNLARIKAETKIPLEA
ncbi:MAG: Lrp/AsnC family transcriptional regulator [Proteobacteria bacterium]|nr:Lrp/AsnC family transcriptional regulator [Pseudomonadota bacterium]MBI3496687.1 Lrp/AsnC family transcriptional regulator [Pseudomonadota bacterium]